MKWTFLSFFMIIWVACTSNHHSSGHTTRNKPMGVSDIMKCLTSRVEFSGKEESYANTDRSYHEEIEKFQVPVHHYPIDAQMDNEITVGSRGTVLHIPKDILVNKNGMLYQGNANIHFKEYTNSAEIAFSGIPMTYYSGREELRFNSAGMFEVTATGSTGEELFIGRGKLMTVDYPLVRKNPGTDFYRLDEKTKRWRKISTIVPPVEMDSFIVRNVVTYIRSWEDVPYTVDNDRTIKFKREPVYGRQVRDSMVQYVPRTRGPESRAYINNGIVSGLSVAGFGIYNCDQAYRISNPVTINVRYVNKETGEQLKDLNSLSLIDLSFIGAFSVPCQKFSLDAKARNTLLLFTQSGELYFFSEESFRSTQLINNASYEFPMTNVTNRVKNTEDLQKLLGI